MTQESRRLYLIQALMKERAADAEIMIPEGEPQQKALLRSLFNQRMPAPAAKEFLEIQDAYLQEETARKGITDLSALKPLRNQIYLWRGDITALRCEVIVNAANAQLLGCFCPNHNCIDNQIHTFSGVQLRLACAGLMLRQGHAEKTGGAKLTPAFNLPCRYVLHTVGPMIRGRVTREDEKMLASCYRSCLALAAQNDIKSIAFCCISTGEYNFPHHLAATIAVNTVREYLRQKQSGIKVIFNVFKEIDDEIYKKLLHANQAPESRN